MVRREALCLAVLGLVGMTTAFIPGGHLQSQRVMGSRPLSVSILASSMMPEPDNGPEDDEDLEGINVTEVDGIMLEGDFDDDSVKPNLSSLLEDADEQDLEPFKLESDDAFFSIPDYVPSELPDLAALGQGLMSKRGLDFGDGEFDPDDPKMYKMLGLDVLDEKKTPVPPEGYPIPAPYQYFQDQEAMTAKYQKHEGDTGSAEVQIARLTVQVNYLTKHVQANPKDFSARRGLLRAVNLRKRQLNYLFSKDRKGAVGLADELGVRYRPPEKARSKFEMYRNFKNIKSKKAKNMQLAAEQRNAAAEAGR
jgi:small subunit ribosomal protein S15